MKQIKLILVKAVIEYAKILRESKTSVAAGWTVELIEKFTKWCVYIEIELAVLPAEERERVLQMAATMQKEEEIPSVSILLNAMHMFYQSLIQSVFVNNSVYLYLMKHYQFLTLPEKDTFTKDLTQLASNAATKNVLNQMLKELDD